MNRFWSALVLALAFLGCKKQPAANGTRHVVVVLGSSTAAGLVGLTSLSHAWVNRYRAYLGETAPSWEVENLAANGSTTYQIQADDYAPPPGRPAPVPGRNITAALALHPSAIVINLPSNDVSNDIPVAEQMTNFTRVTDLARARGVPVWVTTTQPRNFSDVAQRNAQMEGRDAIQRQYGDHTIDFWTGVAEADGTIKVQFDSGDQVHLNDAGHQLLFDRVVAAAIPAKLGL
jgi:lysophospholipase L1-like esterase